MNDVSAVGVEEWDDPYKNFDSKPELWKEIGQSAYTVFSLIAIGACLPALFKKKRVYSLELPGQVSQVVEVAEEPVVERGPEPERAKIHWREPDPQKYESIRMTVETIFRTIAQSGAAGLLWNATSLKNWGKQIDHIHPFLFLFCAPKTNVQQIFAEEGSLVGNGKIDGVMGGIRKGLEREFAKDNLTPHIASFAAEIGKEAGPIKSLIKDRNWRGLVNYLFLN